MRLNPFMPRRKEPTMNLVGPQLRKIREGKGISQDELAASCQRMGWDVSRMTITRIELRNRLVSDFEIYILGKALGINAKDLMPDAPSLDVFLKEDVRSKFLEQRANKTATDASEGSGLTESGA